MAQTRRQRQRRIQVTIKPALESHIRETLAKARQRGVALPRNGQFAAFLAHLARIGLELYQRDAETKPIREYIADCGLVIPVETKSIQEYTLVDWLEMLK